MILVSGIQDCSAKNRRSFSLPMRKAYLPLARILVELGLINGFSVLAQRLQVFVRYFVNGTPVITLVKKPGLSSRRVYFNTENRHPIERPFRLVIVTTTKGLMVLTSARMLGIGGRVLLEIA